jgi:hypothetical protein
MEKAINQGAIEAMAEAVLNPEFQAALDSFEPELDALSDEYDPIAESEESAESAQSADEEDFEDPEFAALAAEVEAEAADVVVPEQRPVIDAGSADAAEMKISPFALLVNPAPAYAAAKRLETLGLPRRVVFLFGKKGVTTNPEISRLDQDMDLEADDDLEDEVEETVTEQ